MTEIAIAAANTAVYYFDQVRSLMFSCTSLGCLLCFCESLGNDIMDARRLWNIGSIHIPSSGDEYLPSGGA